MRASEHDGADGLFHVRKQERAEICLDLRPVQIAVFHKFHQAGTSKRGDFRAFCVAPKQLVKLLPPDCEGCRHHDDARMLANRDSGLQGRLDADDRDVGIDLPQNGNGCACGGIAGDDKRLDAASVEHFRMGERQPPDLFQRLCPVRRISGIPEIDIIFLRHQPDGFPQDTQPAQPGVKKTDGEL